MSIPVLKNTYLSEAVPALQKSLGKSVTDRDT